MRRSHRSWLWWLLLCSPGVCAQTVIGFDERLASDRPEAWAMNYVAASTFMTAYGPTPALEPGRWAVALDVGYIPRVDEAQRRVGFNGTKLEDLNKSPLVGRLRGMLGLPRGWVAELGYTPPIRVDGARPDAMFAAALGRRLLDHGAYSLSLRAFGLHGGVEGDITCPEALAGNPDFTLNPYGCRAPSNDHATLNHYGLDLTGAFNRWHASLGVARTETDVQVDALTFNVRDRSRLVARDVLPFLVVGMSRDVDPHWTLAVELLHVPLSVRREPGGPSENDPLTSLRFQLRYRGE